MGIYYSVFTNVFTNLFFCEILLSDQTKELKVKLYEIDYNPILCTKRSDQVGKFYMAEYSSKVVIEAKNREEATEKFHQGNHGLINTLTLLEEAS